MPLPNWGLKVMGPSASCLVQLVARELELYSVKKCLIDNSGVYTVTPTESTALRRFPDQEPGREIRTHLYAGLYVYIISGSGAQSRW